MFIQEDYNKYLTNLLKDRNEFIGNELSELNKKLVFSELKPLGLNTKSIANSLRRINEQYMDSLKTQENTPIKSSKTSI